MLLLSLHVHVLVIDVGNLCAVEIRPIVVNGPHIIHILLLLVDELQLHHHPLHVGYLDTHHALFSLQRGDCL